MEKITNKEIEALFVFNYNELIVDILISTIISNFVTNITLEFIYDVLDKEEKDTDNDSYLPVLFTHFINNDFLADSIVGLVISVTPENISNENDVQKAIEILRLLIYHYKKKYVYELFYKHDWFSIFDKLISYAAVSQNKYMLYDVMKLLETLTEEGYKEDLKIIKSLVTKSMLIENILITQKEGVISFIIKLFDYNDEIINNYILLETNFLTDCINNIKKDNESLMMESISAIKEITSVNKNKELKLYSYFEESGFLDDLSCKALNEKNFMKNEIEFLLLKLGLNEENYK